MGTHPETHYAKTADGVNVAYQAFGDGPVDILFVLGWVTHIERMWDQPRIVRFLERLATLGRVMVFDKRGVGMSDRVPDDRLPSLEVRIDDARAVMDAVGSERAVVLGHSEGGPMATLFAATHPERAIALALFGTAACWNNASDYPFSRPTHEHEAEMASFRERRDRLWGTEELAREYLEEAFAPSYGDDTQLVAWLADYMRNAASPGAVNAFSRMNAGIDVRSALPAIHVPTLVLARDDDLDVPMAETKWMAEQIRGARFLSFPGNDHYIFLGNQGELLDEIERFVAEVRARKPTSTACSLPCFSPISSTRPRPQRSWATRAGERSSSGTTGSSERCSAGSAAPRSTPPATASSRPSTVRRGPCAARRRSPAPCRISGSRCGPAYTPARWSRSPGRSAGSP